MLIELKTNIRGIDPSDKKRLCTFGEQIDVEEDRALQLIAQNAATLPKPSADNARAAIARKAAETGKSRDEVAAEMVERAYGELHAAEAKVVDLEGQVLALKAKLEGKDKPKPSDEPKPDPREALKARSEEMAAKRAEAAAAPRAPIGASATEESKSAPTGKGGKGKR